MQLDQAAHIILLVDAVGRNVVVALLYRHCCELQLLVLLGVGQELVDLDLHLREYIKRYIRSESPAAQLERVVVVAIEILGGEGIDVCILGHSSPLALLYHRGNVGFFLFHMQVVYELFCLFHVSLHHRPPNLRLSQRRLLGQVQSLPKVRVR